MDDTMAASDGVNLKAEGRRLEELRAQMCNSRMRLDALVSILCGSLPTTDCNAPQGDPPLGVGLVVAMDGSISACFGILVEINECILRLEGAVG